MAKNWIKKVSDTMVDLELDDTLKLRVATRLLELSGKSSNFVLLFLLFGSCSYESLMISIILIFIATRNDKNSLGLDNGESL